MWGSTRRTSPPPRSRSIHRPSCCRTYPSGPGLAMTIPGMHDTTTGVLERSDPLIGRNLGTVILAFCAILPFPGDLLLWPALLALVSYALLARRHVVPH